MRVAEKVTPVLAALGAVGTIACCLPLGGAAALGLGGVLGVLGAYQEWLLPVSGLLLAVGSLQIWRSRRICARMSWASLIVLALSAAVVLLVMLVPQAVAGFLTDWIA